MDYFPIHRFDGPRQPATHPRPSHVLFCFACYPPYLSLFSIFLPPKAFTYFIRRIPVTSSHTTTSATDKLGTGTLTTRPISLSRPFLTDLRDVPPLARSVSPVPRIQTRLRVLLEANLVSSHKVLVLDLPCRRSFYPVLASHPVPSHRHVCWLVLAGHWPGAKATRPFQTPRPALARLQLHHPLVSPTLASMINPEASDGQSCFVSFFPVLFFPTQPSPDFASGLRPSCRVPTCFHLGSLPVCSARACIQRR